MKINFENIPELEFQASEAYKTLRTNIQFCGEEIKAVNFTSCQPNEGKSVLVFRLSIAMAETGKKVLLIDADIRKSVLATRFQADKVSKGLSEYLTGQCKQEECICSTNVENMDVLMPGPIAPNPSEILGTEKFKLLVKSLREQYDYIFIDCPPLGSVIDAAVVSTVTDGAILIVEDGADSYKFVQKVKSQLEKSGCKILGAVLNKVDIDSKGYYGKGYYGKYYGKSYGSYNTPDIK